LATIDDIEINSSDFAICSLVLTNFSANFQSAFRNPHSAIVDPVARPPRLARMAGRHAHLLDLATVIHEISGLKKGRPNIDLPFSQIV